jgi:hypothetical protein
MKTRRRKQRQEMRKEGGRGGVSREQGTLMLRLDMRIKPRNKT